MKCARLVPVSRGLALFLGGFSLLNVLGDFRTPGFDANLWWIDFRPLSPTLSRAFLVLAAALMLWYALRPSASAARRRSTIVAITLLLTMTVWNAIHFYLLLAAHDFSTDCPIPFSALVSVSLLLVLLGMKDQGETASRSRALMTVAVLLCIIAFPLAQIYCFGRTDYRRPADAIVVFGARAFRNGRCSRALRDRVRTGCQLYLDGLARTVIFSGGPGDGAVTEPEAMRRYAIRLGVSDKDILLDPKGLDTEATARNTCGLFAQHGIKRVMVVSHFYHLPRIKMTYRRHG